MNEWRLVRDARLRALQEAPYAFGSTYAAEAELTDADWQRRSQSATQFLALDGAEVIGLATAQRSPTDPSMPTRDSPERPERPERREWQLFGMWVDPRYRRMGLAQRLIQQVVDLAGKDGAQWLRLSVVRTNERALRTYLNFGFAPTGPPHAMPRDAAVFEQQLVLALEQDPVS